MKKFLFLSLTAMVLWSCGTSQKATSYKKPTSSKNLALRNLKSTSSYTKNSGTVNNLLNSAENYLGSPYKYGGNAATGFDCSGFVCKVFDENNMKLSRRSADQAKEGKAIDISEAKAGDLLFFATSGAGKISHVGIVHQIENNGEIKFIHASTSKGVIISSLNETYWNKAFLFARRLL